jgi:serine phosphatase RsbU (regulator of sigma subunit)
MAGRPPEADTVLRTGEFEILSATVGAFHKYILRGRFNDDMLGALQRQVLIPTQNMAIDAGGLSGITMALARSVYYTFQAMRGQGLALVLLNPPDSLRGFLRLLGADQRVPVLLSESQLPARPADAAQAAEKLEKELQAFKKELEGNNLWQFVDREFCWVCPFCGEVREEVRIPSRLAVPQGSLEKVWRHLNFDCRRYVPAKPRYLTREELEAKTRKASQEKLAAAREHVEALQSKVVNLQEKAQWADQVQKGVKIAASRQRRLLPTKAPEIPGCEVSFTYRSADEVSGDFYDFVEMDDRRTAFVIGDVSGHGIEAGILMGMTKKVLSIRLAELGDPVAAMRKANADILKDLDRSSFVTAAAIVFDRVSRKLTCARAGHNPPLLYNPARGKDCKRFELGGLMLGMAAPKVFDAQMAGEVMQVQPGDVLLLYTDGLEEGKDPSGQEFGVQRIIAALQAEHAKPGPYLLGALFYEFDRFSSGVAQEDDLTAVCVRFK